jgi:nucleoside-diphosphate-sugar epimerase
MPPSPDGLNVVLGAGPVGRALVHALTANGRRVRVATRSGRATLPHGVEVVGADVSSEEDARRACAGAAIVYACVGLDYRNWPAVWPPMMRGMLAGAEAAGARFVFMDNLYMYGPAAGPLTEDLPLTYYGRKPATRARITRMWQEAHSEKRVQAVAVRASDFYGPGVTMAALGDYSFGNIARGKPAQALGDVDQPHSFTYVPDIARALVTIGEAGGEAMGQAWHVPNAPDQSVRQILQMFADSVGKDLRVRVVSPAMLSILGLFVRNLREMKEMMYEWDRPFEVVHSKFASRFWSDATPFETGIRATADWYARR